MNEFQTFYELLICALNPGLVVGYSSSLSSVLLRFISVYFLFTWIFCRISITNQTLVNAEKKRIFIANKMTIEQPEVAYMIEG